MVARGYVAVVSEDVSLSHVLEARFSLPFAPSALFAELSNTHRPLAADAQIEYRRVGGGSGQADRISQGLVRRADFKRAGVEGHTLSICTDLRPNAFIKWRQLETRKQGVQLLESKQGGLPESSVGLAVAEGGGSEVHLKYSFDSISGGAPAQSQKD